MYMIGLVIVIAFLILSIAILVKMDDTKDIKTSNNKSIGSLSMNENNNLYNQIDSNKDELDRLNKYCECLYSQYSDEKDKNSSLSEKIQLLELELSETKSAHETLINERKDLEKLDSWMDFFHWCKELQDENNSLSNKNEKLELDLSKMKSKYESLKNQMSILNSSSECSCNEPLSEDASTMGKEDKEKLLQSQCNILSDKIIKNKEILSKIQNKILEKGKELSELNDEVLLQEFGLYEPVYDFSTSEMYKEKLKEIRFQQREMILNKTAAVCHTTWTLNNSLVQGRVMTKLNIKQILRCFNDECDILISKVKFNNVDAFIDKIEKSYDTLNELNYKNDVSISREYLDLKLKELRLAYEYAQKKQDEKEERQRIKEQMREEAKLMEEIEVRRKDIEKEMRHYTRQLSQINELISKAPEDEIEYLSQKKEYIDDRLKELNREIEEMDYREANKKAGYVYVISNIGAFGENVYKIGMTRRLEPMDRIDELSNASVPFRFDVHAMIFSDDAPSLENALHKAFENRKINMVNGRKEFFKVSLNEIKAVVKNNYDKSVEFVEIPTAEQYRESLRMFKSMGIDNNIHTPVQLKLF